MTRHRLIALAVLVLLASSCVFVAVVVLGAVR